MSIKIALYPTQGDGDADAETFGISINGVALGVNFRTYDDVAYLAHEIAAKAISPSGVVTIDYHACLPGKEN